uniref:Uncharacterized protein n=2 Tax=Oryza TaxID=4527 RepID=A0A0E0Q120_ORYRU
MKSIKESSNQEVRKVLTYGFHDSKSFKTCQAGDSSSDAMNSCRVMDFISSSSVS